MSDSLLYATCRAMAEAGRSESRNINLRQLAVLLRVYTEEGHQTVQGLADALAVQKMAITRALNRLEELGYVQRQRSIDDRREVIAGRTPAGAALIRAIAAWLAEAAGRLPSA